MLRASKEKDLDLSFNKNVGLYLRNIREAQKLTLEQLAIRVNTTKQNIYKYESCKSRIKLDMFISICNALSLNPSTAYNDILEMTKKSSL